jgi:hypothetical protein
MENTQTPVTSEQYEANKKKQKALQGWFNFLVGLVVFIAVGLIVWIFFLAPIKEADAIALSVGANLTLVMAPVLAAAAGVERSLETIFNIIESSWKSLVANLGRGLRWLNAAEIEVSASRQWLSEISAQYNKEMDQIKLGDGLSVAQLSEELQGKIAATKTLLDLAEERLKKAENNLASVTSSEGYKNVKTAASIVLGLVFGMIVATLGQLQMFAMLGVGGVPARVDVFITGLVIGSGSYPVHSLVGILQQTKDTLDGAKSYLSQTAKKNPLAGGGNLA